MKKITIMGIAILLLAACQKESLSENAKQGEALSAANAANQSARVRVTRPIAADLQSNPDPNPTTPYGGAIFYGSLTHLGNAHGKTMNTSFTAISANQFSITSKDITYAANGDELWTEGNLVLTIPTDGSTIATITGGSKITGGTGRFSGATGYFIYENMVYDIVSGHESHISHGEITF